VFSVIAGTKVVTECPNERFVPEMVTRPSQPSETDALLTCTAFSDFRLNDEYG
jgi:hypothetical protein